MQNYQTKIEKGFFQRFFQNIWKKQFSWYLLVLLPCSYIFYLIQTIRKFLYKIKILKSHAVNCPVIVVGNLHTGGSGKSPLVVSIAKKLKNMGYNVGIISRGYKKKSNKSCQILSNASSALDVGDELLMIYYQTECKVAVGNDRYQCANTLLKNFSLDFIISDDGLSHYKLKRDYEIVVWSDHYKSKFLLPAGPLRESISRLNTVDAVVTSEVNKESSGNKYAMTRKLSRVYHCKNKDYNVGISSFSGKKVIAIAAIAHPENFFEMLANEKIEVEGISFPDHYSYQKEDLSFPLDVPVLTTKKDAVKLQIFKDIDYWVVEVEAMLCDDFYNDLLAKCKKEK